MPGQDLRDSSERNEVKMHVCVPEEADVIDLLSLSATLSMPCQTYMEWKNSAIHMRKVHRP